MSRKELLFSVTAQDCEFEVFRGTGKGGQKKNKTSSAVRCRHKESGAVGTCQDDRKQHINKRIAFTRMAETDKFKAWLKLKISTALGKEAIIEENVKRAMHPSQIKIEIKDDHTGKWVEAIDLE